MDTITTKELRQFPSAVESLLTSHISSVNSDGPIKWGVRNNKKSDVVTRSRRFKEGDFTISRAVLHRALPEEGQKVSFINRLQAESHRLPLPIQTATITPNGPLSIRLDRPIVFQKVIADVVTEGDKYGHQVAGDQDSAEGAEVVLNNAPVLNHYQRSSNPGKDGVSLGELRGALFCAHLKKILESLGLRIHNINYPISSQLQNILETFQIPSCAIIHPDQEKIAQTQHKLISQAKRSKYRTKNKKILESADDGDGNDDEGPNIVMTKASQDAILTGHSNVAPGIDGNSSDVDGVKLDLRQYVNDTDELLLGRGKFDKNIHLTRLTDEDEKSRSLLHQCARLEETCQLHQSKTKVIHIASKTREHHQQQVDLTWRIISYTDISNISQLHTMYGPVITKKSTSSNQDITVEEFYKIREAQTREACVMKYGPDIEGTPWEDVITQLTLAGIKFELLGMQLSSQVKLDISDTRENTSWPDSRDGVFVMYNYARLATLFSNYDKEVSNGVYPALPTLDSIDFTTLREDQEWGLLFNYVLMYPSLLQDVHDKVLEEHCAGSKVNLQTHKICVFFVSLSRDLSSYYRHVHILWGGQPHLLPVMFARLYLMKSIQHILRNGLTLLDIWPLEQM